MAETVKPPRPWLKTLTLVSLPLKIINLIMGILMADFVGGCIAGVMGAALISDLINAMFET